MPVAGLLVERVHVIDKGRRRGLVEPVEQVEAFGNDVQPEALAKTNRSRQSRIERHVVVRKTHIAR